MMNRNDEGQTRRTPGRVVLSATVLATALVGSMVTSAGPASAAVPGLTTVTATSGSNSSSPKTVIVNCPAGRQLVSTGAEIAGGRGEVVIDDLRPNGGPAVAPTSVFVTAYEEDPLAGDWSVRGYAVCADWGLGLVRIAASTSSASTDVATATAACPAGKRPVGTGAEITGGFGEIVLDDLRPNGGPGVAPTRVAAVAYEADPNYAPNWNLTSYAICANAAAVPGLATVAVTSPGAASPDVASVTATCPAGKKRIGTGARVDGGLGEIVIDDLTPFAVTAYEADPNYVPNWTVTSYAICVNV